MPTTFASHSARGKTNTAFCVAIEAPVLAVPVIEARLAELAENILRDLTPEESRTILGR